MKERPELLGLSELLSLWRSRARLASLASFNYDDVPEGLRRLIPYAEVWGVYDSLEQERILEWTPPELSAHLIAVVRLYNDELLEWLAGDESWSDNPTDAYVAFSVLIQSSDLLDVVLAKK